MMLLTWIAVFLVASIQTYFVLSGKAGELFLPIIGIVLSSLLCYGGLSLEVATSSGIQQNPNVLLVLLGLASLAINAVYLFSSSLESISSAFAGGR